MRSRRRSIRRSLYGLLVIPMVSLLALWGFAAQSVASEVIHQRNIDTANEIYGNAVQPMLVTLAQERQESVVWLAGAGALPRTSLDAVRKKMDGTIVAMNGAANSDRFQRTLNGPMKSRLSTLIDKLNQIGTVRSQVDSGSMNKLTAFEAYNDILDTHFDFMYALMEENSYRQTYPLTGMSRAIELSGREAALVGGVLVGGGRMTAAEHTAITKLVFERRYLETSSLIEFNTANGAPFKQALASPAVKNFTEEENRVIATRPGARLRLKPAVWQAAAMGYIGQLDQALGKSRVVLAGDAKKTSDQTVLRLALVGGLGLLAIVLTAFFMIRFGRRIIRDLRELQGSARSLANERLPGVVRRLSRGDDVDVAAEAPPLEVGKTAEVYNVADAFSTVQRTAIEAAVGQAELRKVVNRIFQNLARRNQSLLHRQLSMLDTLERKASDPDALSDLFAIDHLTTRMRRHAEGLIILSGAAPGRGWRHPISVLDVLRGAVGEIEDYARVDVVSDAEEGIVGSAVADVIHLLAELIENAASLSPPNTTVEVDAGLVGQGFVVEIQDRGLGMSEEKLAAINAQLAREPEFDLADGDQLGLFVVGNLAHRHGIKVTLEPNAYGGIKTIVLLPHSIIVSPDKIGQVEEGEESADAPAEAQAGTGAPNAGQHGAAPQATGPQGVAPQATGPLGAVPQATGPLGAVPSATGPQHVGVPSATGPQQIIGEEEREYAMDGVGRHRIGSTEPGAGHAPFGEQSPVMAAPPPAPAPGPSPRPASGQGTPPPPPQSADGGTHAGMPRRVRRANLAPQLRNAEPPAQEEQPAQRTRRSPERARSVMSSMQSGWRRGRAEPLPPSAGRNEREGER